MSVVADAFIEGVEVAPGHDGAAEVVVRLCYPNGAVQSLAVDGDAMAEIVSAHGIAELHELVGHPWSILIDGVRPGAT